MQSYLAERNYVLLYLYNMFYRASTVVIHVFTGAYLVQEGYALWVPLVFYAVVSTLAGLLAPVGLKVISKVGIVKTAYFSILCRLLFFITFLNASIEDPLFWLGTCIYGLSYGLYPFKEVVEAIFVTKDKYRGRQLTMSLVLSGGMAAFAVALAGATVVHFGYIGIAVLSIFFYGLAITALSFMKAEPFHVDDYRIIDGYKFAKSKHLNGLQLFIFGQQAVILTAALVVPLFLYSVVGDMVIYSYIATMVVVLEIVSTLAYGQIIDRVKAQKSYKTASWMMASSFMFMLLFVKTPLSAVLVDSFTKMSLNNFSATSKAVVHRVLRKNDKRKLLLYGTSIQLNFSLWQGPSLLILAGLSLLSDTLIFAVAFCASAMGALLCYRGLAQNYLKQHEDEENAAS